MMFPILSYQLVDDGIEEEHRHILSAAAFCMEATVTRHSRAGSGVTCHAPRLISTHSATFNGPSGTLVLVTRNTN